MNTISDQAFYCTSSLIVRVIKKDLGAYPEDLFLNFEEKPIASG
jgi:predicted unusual protein kinase regulating ubiquinone biosynthesis (AarF/ABC1/UbiB family)